MTTIKMTEMQKAYFIGREDITNGATGTHLYMEILFSGTSLSLESALNKVIVAQPFLRAQIGNNMDFIIKDELQYNIIVTDGDPNDKDKTQTIRSRLSHKVYSQNNFPLFTIELLGQEGRYRIFLSIDMLIADGLSLYELCHEIKYYLNHSDEAPKNRLEDLLFMVDYYNDQRSTNRYFKSRDYYLKNLDIIAPAPTLGYSGERLDGEFFHLEKTISKEDFSVLCQHAESNDFTATDILLTAYALVLSKWSRFNSMSINMTTFLRPRDEKYFSVIGDFTTSMLIQSNISWEDSFIENVKKLKKSMFVAYKHSLFEVPEIVREMAKINPGVTMPVVFTSMLFDGGDLWDDSFQYDYWISQTSQVNLDSQVKKLGDKLNITWDYRKSQFNANHINAMFCEYIDIIKSYIAGTHDVLSQYKTHFLEETVALYARYNSHVSCSSENISLSLKEMFEQTVRKYGKKTFVFINDIRYTYEDIYDKALTMTKLIQDEKKKHGKRKIRFAFAGRKTIESITNIVAAILNNDSFCVINEDYGEDKKHETLMQLGNYVLINDGELIFSNDNAEVNDDESYVLFTSGTTGKPKGIVITEKAALNTVLSINDMYKVSVDDVILNISNLYFDLSIYDIFASMIIGCEVVSVNPLYWNSVNDEIANSITIWNSTPALAKEYAAKQRLQNIRLILMSGDFVAVSLVEKLYGLYKENVKIISLGGATEASIWSNYFDCNQPHNATAIPYGYPLYAQQLYVINADNGYLCQENVLGEICIAGVGLAVGYLDQEQTSQSFVYNNQLDKKIYKTGDLGFLSDDGKIYIVGRISQEIKHNGYRIDLREIEKYITSVDKVTNSLVFLEKQNESRTRLFAVVESNDRNIDVTVRDYLSANLPYYMIPSSILVVKKFPLTNNGKVDTNELRDWLKENDEIVDECSNEEKELLLVWKKTIPDERYIEITHRDATYFDAGGQSLQAVDLKTDLANEYAIDIPLQDVLSHISLRSMLKYINDKKSVALSRENKDIAYESCVGEIVLLRTGTTNKNIVFIHAGSGEINVYLGVAKYIDEEYNVYAIKRRHDMSRVAPGDFSFSNFAIEYNNILSTFENIEILGGWCIGGCISYEMSLLNPQKYKNLLFINAEAPIPDAVDFAGFNIKDELKLIESYGALALSGKDMRVTNVEELWQAIIKIMEVDDNFKTQFINALPNALLRLLPPLGHLSAKVVVYYVNHWRSAYAARDHYKGNSKSASQLLYLNAIEEPMEGFEGWVNFVDDFSHFDIQGDHASLFAEHNVSLWCAELNKKLKSWKLRT